MANPTEAAFDPKAFLISAGPGRSRNFYETGSVVYRQADACSAVFYVKSGKVKMVVSSKQG